MIATTVIIFGRTRSTAPCMMASCEVAPRVKDDTFEKAARASCISDKRVVEVDQHHDARLGRDTRKRDEAHGDGERACCSRSSHISQSPAHKCERQLTA